jgi:hypothetical protein
MIDDIVSNSVTNFGEPNDGMPDMRDPDDIISHGTWHHYRIGLSKCILKINI